MRITATLDAVKRALYRIETGNDETVYVIPRSSDHHKGGSRLFKCDYSFEKDDHIKEERYSLHPSPNRFGTTLKKSVRVGSDKVESKLLLEENLESVRTIIHARLWPNLLNRIYDVKDKDGEYLNIANLNTAASCNLLSILTLVTREEVNHDIDGFSSSVIDIKGFRLVFYSTLLDLAPTDFGASVSPSTFAPEKNRERIIKPTGFRSSPSMSQKELKQNVLRYAQYVSALYVTRLIEDEKFDRVLSEVPLWFHSNLGQLMVGRICRARKIDLLPSNISINFICPTPSLQPKR